MNPQAGEASELSRGKPAGIIEDCAAYLNGSLQELAKEAPFFFKTDGGGYIRAPISVSGITATEGSTAISGFSAYTAAMRGCTIRLGSDAYDHEIRSATELACEYGGTTGSGLTGTVYFDCIPLDSTIAQVVAPIFIPGIGEIGMANDRTEFILGSMAVPVATTYPVMTAFAQNSYNKQIGRPIRWMCEEGGYSATQTSILHLLRFYPMPAQACRVNFQKIVKPPTYTAADIDNDDGGNDPGTVIPFDEVESRLMPIFTRNWLKHPSFGNREARDDIRSDAVRAIGGLEDEKPGRGPRRIVYTNA